MSQLGIRAPRPAGLTLDSSRPIFWCYVIHKREPECLYHLMYHVLCEGSCPSMGLLSNLLLIERYIVGHEIERIRGLSVHCRDSPGLKRTPPLAIKSLQARGVSLINWELMMRSRVKEEEDHHGRIRLGVIFAFVVRVLLLSGGLGVQRNVGGA